MGARVGLVCTCRHLGAQELSADSERCTSDPPSSEQRDGAHEEAYLSRSNGASARAHVLPPRLGRGARSTLDHDPKIWTTTSDLDHDPSIWTTTRQTGDAPPHRNRSWSRRHVVGTQK